MDELGQFRLEVDRAYARIENFSSSGEKKRFVATEIDRFFSVLEGY